MRGSWLEIRGDLLDQPTDVIVNAWNRNFLPWWLLWPQGVSGAIRRRAGTAPFREVWRAGIMPVGGAVLTSAGRLPHQGIIHVAGLHAHWMASEFSIRQSVRSALAIVAAQRFTSVAFPVIGGGTGGLRAGDALRYMRETVLEVNPAAEVRIVHFTP